MEIETLTAFTYTSNILKIGLIRFSAQSRLSPRQESPGLPLKAKAPWQNSQLLIGRPGISKCLLLSKGNDCAWPVVSVKQASRDDYFLIAVQMQTDPNTMTFS